jgi:hypothetical protein
MKIISMPILILLIKMHKEKRKLLNHNAQREKKIVEPQCTKRKENCKTTTTKFGDAWGCEVDNLNSKNDTEILFSKRSRKQTK